MVRAILAGQKTQTRRLLKKPVCPYGAPGDRLWVRETWCPLNLDYRPAPRREKLPADTSLVIPSYRADHRDPRGDAGPMEWRPSIFMPRWASRILLEVVAVSNQRLQDISEEDAVKDGIPTREDFALSWDHIYGVGSWKNNPLVWVVEFRALPNK
jgi:hypothetical protein